MVVTLHQETLSAPSSTAVDVIIDRIQHHFGGCNSAAASYKCAPMDATLHEETRAPSSLALDVPINKVQHHFGVCISADAGQECTPMDVSLHQDTLAAPSSPALEDDILERHRVSGGHKVYYGGEAAMAESPLCKDINGLQEASNIEPFEGMEFESDEAARMFYDEYARNLGFTIRSSISYRSRRDGELITRKFVCARQGFYKRKDIYKHPRTSKKEGCMALLHLKRRKSGRWIIVKVIKEHNHDLMSVRKLHSVQPDKNFYNPAKSLTDSFEGEEEASDHSSPHVKEISSGNTINYGDCTVNLGWDTQSLLEYLHRKQAENPGFFYAIQVDEEQCMKNVIWIDAVSRMSYRYFCDLVFFGMIFERNQNHFSFFSFTGMNHHEQPISFGCALLSSNSMTSYIWLFNTWLTAMSGCHPKAIVTFQDQSIQAAVSQVLPKTHYRIDNRSILGKVREKLGHVCKAKKSFEEELRECVNMDGAAEEFESRWEVLLDRYNLKDNEWLQWLYNVRCQWIPVYLRETFFAELPTQGHSGSLNSVFTGYVTAEATLQEFIKQHENALDSQYEKEAEADFQTNHTKPVFKTASPVERQAAQAYTRKVFSRFQEELFQTCAYVAKRYKEDSVVITYMVKEFGDDSGRACSVKYDAVQLKVTCSCRMFEFSGILCRHALAVFRMENVFNLPLHYFLKRWTRDAKTGAAKDNQTTEFNGDSCRSLTSRYNSLCQEAIMLAAEGSVSMDAYEVSIQALREALSKLLGKKSLNGGIHLENISGGMNEDDCSEGSEEESMGDRRADCFLPPSKSNFMPLTPKLNPDWENSSQNLRLLQYTKPVQ